MQEAQPTEEGARTLISPTEGFDAYNAAHEHGEHEHIHIPPPSYWPILLSIAVTILFIGMLRQPTGPGVPTEELTGPQKGLLQITSASVKLPGLPFDIPIMLTLGVILTLAGIIMWGLEGSESIPNALTYVPVVGGGDADDKLAQGARVITTDGKVIGRITHASETSPLVRQGWIPTRYGYLARSFIDHIEEGMIYLNVSEMEAKQRGNVDTTPAGAVMDRLAAPTGSIAVQPRTPTTTEKEG